ncbi:hypothetical protein EYR40_003534 [Pleurotus pulmonarius]|nr:hypothetical protein EYR40_003534 [Pleurotus pulmonarius]KAF4606253.1 hypothetical protein EYR38_000305 [Pleurotus pulmonarius]
MYSEDESMMDDAFPADQKRDPFSEIQLSSTRTRTLKRTLSDEFSPGGNSGPIKSRRVDPERLACRLDPNLVQDMEILIAQGSRMPPFEIRKELQERYKVDRRHIYDYFHSRGMRVAKEDKHRNLSRRRAMLSKTKPQPTFYSSTDISSESTSLVEHRKPPAHGGKAHPTQQNKPKNSKRKRNTQAIVPKLEESPEILPDLAYPDSPPQPVFYREPTPEVKDTFKSEPEDLDIGFEQSPIRQLEADREDLFDEEKLNHLDFAYLDDASESSVYNFDTPLCDPTHVDIFESPRAGRLGIYDLINDNIGCDTKAAECVGSYRSYMEDREQLYFSRLFASPQKSPGALSIELGSDAFISSTTDHDFPSMCSLFQDSSFQTSSFATVSDAPVINQDASTTDVPNLTQPVSTMLPQTAQDPSANSAKTVRPRIPTRQQALSSGPKPPSCEHAQLNSASAVPLRAYMRPRSQSTLRNVINKDSSSAVESLVPSMPPFLETSRASWKLADMRPSRHRTASAGGGL